MVLLIIFLIAYALFTAWGAYEEGIEGLLEGLLSGGIVLVFFFGISQCIGYFVSTKTTTQMDERDTIVSINDGQGTLGKINGGLFVIHGSVNDTQEFSYYVHNTDGSYSLEKQDASKSSIWQDATPQTAHVDITHIITSYPKSWYFLGADSDVAFGHADFHIPPNSIAENFNLTTK